ncbi:threonine/serine dehydratase [Rhizohabitans arisaemae]|uniref:threonine/serine dehydratase n=1 Tax=Rhizohabitans arisaemae TaxID=2720610 RepID=UPI0024B0EB70|nr:threonine/serine dehydratase [Rhizohabitans arisaemae]
MSSLTYADVTTAATRIAGHIRPVTVVEVDPGVFGKAQVWLACEYMQHSGSYKARGAANFTAVHTESGVPEAGIVIASGGNAGLACAWAARRHGVPATVFLPETAPAVKVERLRFYGGRVRQVGTEYAHAAEAARLYSESTGAIRSHAYDHPLIAAGAGTLLPEILGEIGGNLDTVVVAVGGGGLLTGTAIAAEKHRVRVVAVEPENCRALHAALAAGRTVDVPVDSVAADSLGARRVSEDALHWAGRVGARSLLVTDEAIVRARRALWDRRRIVVEHGAATAYAALLDRVYVPEPGERVAIVLSGANTDPSDLVHDPA